jgi:hypothetical protein
LENTTKNNEHPQIEGYLMCVLALNRVHLLPDRRHFPAHRSLVGRREILPACEPIQHIAHQLALAYWHAVIVHALGDGACEGVPIVLGRRARPGGALVYWDDTNKRCTTVATANLLIGVAAAAVAGGAGNTI